MSDTPPSFGQWIKQRRAALDLTQPELANLVGCSLITIQKLEAGTRRPSRQIAERLADHLGMTGEARGQFVRLARAQQRERPGPAVHLTTPPAATLAAQLPLVLTPIIGREAEIAALAAQIEHGTARLFSLVGPAGVGKTRLSLAVATQLRPRFRAGVAFISLAAVYEPELLAATIAQALGFKPGTTAPLDLLISQLHTRQQLLVLDNFEQLLDAAPIVAALLQACSALKVLVTSRERLHVRGEQVVPLAPLALPGARQLADSTALSEVAAVRLFYEVARAAQPDFVLSPTNLAAVAQLCARLDGLPLAIELVAARVALLPPPALLAQFDRQQTLETRGPRDLPVRQQTLRAAFDWSYALLSQGEQALFAQLAVFEHGWALSAASAVCQVAPTISLLPTLAALINKSLLQRLDVPGEPRFALLVTIREYAHAQLVARGELASAQQRHANYYLALAEAARPHLKDAEQQLWLERLNAEHDNLRAALGWLLRHDQIEPAGRMAVALWRFWWVQGQMKAGLNWLTQIVAHGAQLPAVLRAEVLYVAGNLATSVSELAQGESFYRASLTIARQLDDPRLIGLAVHGLGMVLNDVRRYDEARVLLEEGLALDLKLGSQNDQAVSLGSLAGLHYYTGNYTAARELYAAALAIQRAIGDTHSVALTLNNLGEVVRRQGDTLAAWGYANEAVRLMRQLDARRILPYALNNVALLACRQGEYAQARTTLHEALALLEQTGDRTELVASLLGFAELALRAGDSERAWQLVAAIRQLHSAGVLVATEAAAADLEWLSAQIAHAPANAKLPDFNLQMVLALARAI